MLSALLSRRHSAVRDERGFSLIELLVAMLSATIVAGALFAVLNFSTAESSTLSDKVQADQLGRVAMTRIDEELHSACIAPKFTPIQSESNESNLRFITAYSKEAVIPQAELHEIVWTKATGTLIDYSAKNSGGEWPTFTFSEPRTELNRKKSVLATNISKNGETPIFEYFKYASETTEGEKAAVSTLETTPLSGTKTVAGLTTTEAGEAASVLVTFNAAAPDGKTARNRSTNLSSQVTFAFAVPNSETPIHDSPCQ
jgi:Tfp pilus assembly protein PilW